MLAFLRIFRLGFCAPLRKIGRRGGESATPRWHGGPPVALPPSVFLVVFVVRVSVITIVAVQTPAGSRRPSSVAVRPRARTTMTTTTTTTAAAAAEAATTTGPQDLRQRRSFKIACVSRSAADLFPQRHDMSVPWQAAAGGPRIAPGSSYPYFLRSPPFRLISSLFALSLSHFRLVSSLFALSSFSAPLLTFCAPPHFRLLSSLSALSSFSAPLLTFCGLSHFRLLSSL